MNHEKTIVRLFDYFYGKVYKGSNFKIDLSINNQQKVVDNFIKLLVAHYPSIEGIGVNYLIEYFSFSFYSYAEQNLKRNISLNWIIGKKMFKRFLEQTDGHKYYVDRWLFENDINIDDLKFKLQEEDQEIIEGLDAIEEGEKLRFFGDARLYNCIQSTTMYNHRSVNCLACDHKKMCKEILSKVRPVLYKKRGYN